VKNCCIGCVTISTKGKYTELKETGHESLITSLHPIPYNYFLPEIGYIRGGMLILTENGR
jgi:hypothetical protein